MHTFPIILQKHQTPGEHLRVSHFNACQLIWSQQHLIPSLEVQEINHFQSSMLEWQAKVKLQQRLASLGI